MIENCTYGIDNTTIKGFKIESIDFDKLARSHKALVIRGTETSHYHLRNGDSFEYIKIKDGRMFKTFNAGVKINKKSNSYTLYSFMDLSISPIEGNNVKPLTTKSYKAYLSEVLNYLHDEYGVNCTDISTVKFHTMELNINIPLEHKFSEYVRAFQSLMFYAPKGYKDKQLFEDRCVEEIDTLMARNKSLCVKFYNKTKQAKEIYGVDLGSDLLRIEYKLSKPQKIIDIFKNNSVDSLTDLQILNFLKSRFKRDFEYPYDRAVMNNRRWLKKLISKCRKEERYWITLAMSLLWDDESQYAPPKLIDVNDFLDLLRNEVGGNFSRDRRKILKLFPPAYTKQHEKYNEIFSKVANI